MTLSAGDSVVVPRGFIGTWEVVEPTRKIYVIYEPGEYARASQHGADAGEFIEQGLLAACSFLA